MSSWFSLPSDDIEAQRSLTIITLLQQTIHSLYPPTKVYLPTNSPHSTTTSSSTHRTSTTLQELHQSTTTTLKATTNTKASFINTNTNINSQWITFAPVFPSLWHPACPASRDRQFLLPPPHLPRSRLPRAPTSFSPWSSRSRPSLLARRQSHLQGQLHVPSRPTSDLVDPS